MSAAEVQLVGIGDYHKMTSYRVLFCVFELSLSCGGPAGPVEEYHRGKSYRFMFHVTN